MSIEPAIGPAADFLEENGFDDAAALLRGTSAYAAVFDPMKGDARYLPAMIYAVNDESAGEQASRLSRISGARIREVRHLQTGRRVDGTGNVIDGPGEYRERAGGKATIHRIDYEGDFSPLCWQGNASTGEPGRYRDHGARIAFAREGDYRLDPFRIVGRWGVPLSEYVRAVRISESVALAESEYGRESLEALVRIAIERGMNRENCDLFEFEHDANNRVYIVTDPLAPTPSARP